MSTTTGAWIAQLIRAEHENLVTETVTIVRAQVPEYAALPDARLRGIFGQAYTVFAQSLDLNDIGPWRSYFQAALPARASAGISPAGIIPTIEIVQQRVWDLAERHNTAGSTRVAEARSLLRSQANRIRMIISELHLAQVTGTPPPGNPT